MNVLAARVSGMDAKATALTGDIFVNGFPREENSFRRISAYVLQDDRLYPHLTVHETLMISAHFYLPDTVSLDVKESLVDSVIDELGLGKARDTIIGDEKLRGISGGERKRANVAVQLISDPAVLFLDEPTSGLDSFQALAVMESMKNMALHGRLVITVIHQPRSSIFDIFDKLLLLSEGRTIYLGDAKNAAAYFASEGFHMPKFFNPADFFLDVLSPDTRNKELEAASMERIEKMSNAWIKKSSNKHLISGKTMSQEELLGNATKPVVHSAQRFFRNLSILFWRAWSEVSRDTIVIKFKCFQAIFFSSLIGGMYNQIGNTQADIYNRQGLLFIVALNQGFNNLLAVVNLFPKEKIIVNRERSSGAYDAISYFFAKYLAEMPINAIPSVIFGSIVYWVVGLNHDRFGYFLLVILIEIITAIALGMIVSAIAPNADAATAMGIPCIIIALIFAGFYSTFLEHL